MSCSKIFSGDFPELTYDILKYFHNDFSTLHSCILVNRLWCRLVIPLLWENPFSIPTGNYNFIDSYLHTNLNDNLKTKLNEYKINSTSNALFNYSGFIKYLNTREFISFVRKWVENSVKALNIQDTVLLSELNFRKLVNMSLFKLFIQNEVNLHTFYIEIYDYLDYNSYLEDILELILQDPNFFHSIKNLKIYIRYYNNNSLFKDITLRVNNRILQIINSQKNLKGILLGFHNFSLYQSSLSNCLNTLNTITLYHVDFKNIKNLVRMFEQLNALESVHIIYCSNLNSHFIQQIISLTKPFKLKSLFINERSQIDESLLLLLQKSGGHLENFGYNFLLSYTLSLKQQIHESLIKYNKNIKFLDLYESEIGIDYQIFNFIENIKQNLNYLSLDSFGNGDKSSSNILQNLGQFLPPKLEYLNLKLYIKANDLKVFLENSQNTFIEKLLINNKRQNSEDSILPYIKEYIVKKKRVKCLAFIDNLHDLFSMKDEVKEFRLYDIKVQNYYGLTIDIYNFITKIDKLF
jgi:hypothetical protein